ncbi:hypothetical protein CDAR_29211 [Caerostris darwini]|uniref:Uncharacterized protein n=1 Tax=Caerostris darwini TaxID=1538125 RepID=A0AAV4RYY7_9ARAC|nr:hypothetical protein CDAR_29211 [Caerostris darwini]
MDLILEKIKEQNFENKQEGKSNIRFRSKVTMPAGQLPLEVLLRTGIATDAHHRSKWRTKVIMLGADLPAVTRRSRVYVIYSSR